MTDDAVAEAVARTVRTVRAAHGWSLDQLASRSGVSKGLLVGLEQGRGNPSLGTLIKISEALGIALTRLVSVDEEPAVRIFPPARQVALWQGEHGGTGTLLAGSDPRPSLELWSWELLPGEARVSDAHPPGSREIAHVTAGTLTLTCDGQTYAVATGSAAAFQADRPHGYANTTPETCRFFLTVVDV